METTMPKRNPETPDLRPPVPPPLPPADVPPPHRKLRLRLVLLNLELLPEISRGDQVITKSRMETLTVLTPLGSRIGDVSDDDLKRLKNSTVIAGTVFDRVLEPPEVVIEVLVA